MAMFVEVNDVEKGCQVIINLDMIVEIAPLKNGHCHVFFSDAASVGGKRSMEVKDSYSQFKQFAMQTVSSDMIADRISSIQKAYAPVEVKRGPGRPPKSASLESQVADVMSSDK